MRVLKWFVILLVIISSAVGGLSFGCAPAWNVFRFWMGVSFALSFVAISKAPEKVEQRAFAIKPAFYLQSLLAIYLASYGQFLWAGITLFQAAGHAYAREEAIIVETEQPAPAS